MVAAYILVAVEPGKNQDVVHALRAVPAVKSAHVCWGQPDIFAFVEVPDERALADTVLSRIQPIAGVRSTDTHIVMPM
jgi:DNA-binding Lrp family transcriptional regulator